MTTKLYNVSGLSDDVGWGVNGPRILLSAGLFQARDSADTVFVRWQIADSVSDDDAVTRRQLLAAGGALAGSPNVYEDLVFYVDGMDRNSYIGSGADVNDIIANATNGTLTTAVGGDGGFEFNGTTGDLSFDKDAALDNIWSGGGTVISFFRPQTDGESSDGRIVSTEGPTNVDGWHLEVEAESADRMRVTFDLDMSGTDGRWDMDDIDGVRPVQNGGWSSFAMTFDDGDVANDPTMYLNGEGVSSTETLTPTGTPNSDAGNPIVIGNRETDDRTFFGEIGVVLFFDRVLTAVEIAFIHNAFAARYGIGLRGRPEDASGIPAADVEYAAGDYVGTPVSGFGGNFNARGGHANNSTGGRGGRMDLRGGDGVNRGGAFSLRGGEGPGGQDECEVAPGDGIGASTAGDMLIHGGDNVSTGTSGDLVARGGDCTSAGAGTDNGGDFGIAGGQPRSAGDPGNVYIVGRGSSTGTTGLTGDVVITTSRLAVGPFGASGGTDTDTGDVSISTAGGGATSNASGDISLTTGDVNDSTGNNPGDLNVVLGSAPSNANATGGSATITCGDLAGGTNGTAGFFSVTAGDFGGTAATGVGGDCSLFAGAQTNASATGRSGKVELVAGSNAGSGVEGDVEARAYGDGAFLVRTQEGAGFEETGSGKKTLGSQATVGIGGTVTVATLGAITANGNNMKFVVYVTGHDSTTDGDIQSMTIEQTAFRAGGTVTLMTAHQSDKQANGGAAFIADLTFALNTSSNNVILEVTNLGAVPYTLNFAVTWERQLGGIAA